MPALEQLGLFLDGSNQLRVLDPEALKTTSSLIDECNQFTSGKYIEIHSTSLLQAPF